MKSIVRVVRFSWELRRYYLIIAVLTVVVAVVSLASPLLLRSIIDELSKTLSGQEISANLIIIWVALMFAAAVTASILSNIIGYFGDLLAVKLKRLLSNRYYDHLLRLPQKYFDNEHTGAIIARLTRSIESVVRFSQVFTNNFFSMFVEAGLTLVIVWVFSPVIAVLLAVLYPTFFYLTKHSSTKWQAIQTQINDKVDTASSRFVEVVSQIKVVRSFGRERDELDSFNSDYRQIEEMTDKQSRYWHKQDTLRRLAQNVIFLLLFAVIFWQGYNGQLTIGEIVLLIQYSVRAQIPLFSMSFLVDNTQRAISDSRDYFAVMDLPIQDSDKRRKKLSVKGGALVFKNVYFEYSKGEPVLSEVSLRIEPGQKLALIGESGGGKSTIANLLLGLYEPTGGQIEIDGTDITKIGGASLRRTSGVVFQDADLFSGTIFENIAYADPRASQTSVIKAAKAANAHLFIEGFEKGYQTVIGERGLKLSGGQKQRIAIARAILKDAPILILDEATSALDSKSEIVVQDALESLMKGRTSLIIAHRLSTIAGVDRIVVIEEGRVVEYGSPAQLQRSGGTYSKLLRLQTADPSQRKAALAQFDLVG